ncbi:unnamed protein product [Phytophthora fragariaefolia]|uniref:Unnamed protein product n=1 Tax=Phytophthora fragariaefolia TaxID=1490495 RepID=A0A9W7D6F9_9STRA|nr:unnamed protein product [Phytophthora fragariaefolia]
MEVRLATGVVVRTEKRAVRARSSYEEKKFVDELIVLDLDDKFDMVLGMPWRAWHDPVIDWAKRTIVRFGRKKGASALGANAASSADGCKRPAPETLACSRAAGLHDEAVHNQAERYCVRPRDDPADDQKKDLAAAGPRQAKTRGTGFRTMSEQRKRTKLRKSRSGTETLQAVSAGQTQRLETTVETLSVLTHTDTGLQYRSMALESPPTLALHFQL